MTFTRQRVAARCHYLAVKQIAFSLLFHKKRQKFNTRSDLQIFSSSWPIPHYTGMSAVGDVLSHLKMMTKTY